MHARKLITHVSAIGMVALAVFINTLYSQESQEQESAKSAYSQLDPTELAQTLSGLEMSELLNALAEKADPRVMAESLVAKANQPDLSLSHRNKLLEDAAEYLKQSLESMPQSDEPKKLLERYRLRLRIANVLGILRCEPYALRLLYLQGGQEDRRMLREMTKEPISQITMLKQDLEWQMPEWQGDLVKLAVIVPQAEDLLKNIKYKAGWLYLYRALALSDKQRKTTMAQAAATAVDEFARGGEESGVKYWSLLISGIASRIAQNHQEANQYLSQAAGKKAQTPVRIQAMFEIVRNLIESGKYEQALEETERFRQAGEQILQNQQNVAIQIDAKAAMLENYLFEQRAQATENAEKKNEYTRKAQAALYRFIEKHTDPNIQRAFYEIIATRYRQREDYENLNSVVLLALVSRARTQNNPDKALELLDMIIGREDSISQMVRPQALWQTAMIYNSQRQNLKAGENFIKLAEEFPENRLAAQAAKNAAITFQAVVQDRREKDKPVAANIRQNYIHSLEILLNKDQWDKNKDSTDKPELAPWCFDLGWEYEQKAGNVSGEKEIQLLKDAIEAYSKVPPNRPEYMDARFRTLDLRYRILEKDDELAKQKRNNEAEKLASALEAYAKEAAEKAKQTSDQSMSKDLRQWGARSHFLAAVIYYDILERKIIARQKLDNLPEKWPGTPAVRRGAEFEIRKLAAEGQTEEAINKLEDFREKYPQQAGQLINLVIREVRSEIRELRQSDTGSSQLENYKQAYLKFATDLHQRAQDASPQRKYSMNQMYAEALLENGQAEKALSIFQECREYEKKQNQQKINRIEKQLKDQLAKIEAAQNAAQLRVLAEKFLKNLLEYGIETDDIAPAQDVEYAVRKLPEIKDDSVRSDLANRLRNELRKSQNKLAEILKQNLPVDATNLRGLAKAHQALGNYEKSLDFYSQLTAGINPEQYKDLYWSAQADYIRCLLEANRDNKNNLKKILIRIRQMRDFAEQMGSRNMFGYASRFLEIESEVKNLLEK